MTLEQFFTIHPKVAMGFSGGVDSSYLLYAAKKHGADVRPYFIKSQFQPEFELEDAKKIAAHVDVELTILYADALCDERVVKNDDMRCYYCKSNIFGKLKDKALEDGYTVLVDGTNASDDVTDRLGWIAIGELSVLSPLRECGLSKDEIRRLSKEAGLFTWDKPAYACLATRVPTGEPYTEEKLQKIEKAEDFLFSLGFSDFRVRYSKNQAKLQFPKSQIPSLLEKKDEILSGLSDFPEVVLDLKTRD